MRFRHSFPPGSTLLAAFGIGVWLLLRGSATFAGEPATCAPAAPCGDTDASGSVSATDALRELRVAVGVAVSLQCPCSEGICAPTGACGDVDASGKVTASDALRTLKAAVGQGVVLACQCSDGTDLADSLLYGATFYQGNFPPLGEVAFVSRTDGSFTAHDAYLGWVELLVDPGIAVETVEGAIAGAGGAVLAKSPLFGRYLIDAGVGSESAFLTTIYANDWALDGAAVMPGTRGNEALDWDSGPEESSACLRYHGSLVSDIASRRGGAFALESVGELAKEPETLADLVARRMESMPAGQHQVLTMSIAIDLQGGATLAGITTVDCDLACKKKWMAFQEYHFLRLFFAKMEMLWLKNPDVADRSAMTIISGNTGVALDQALAGLRTSFPHAFDRIAIVGGTEADGTVTPGRFNYLEDDSSGNMVYARGVDVSATSAESGPQTCTGTSYAAPEVASVLDAAWAKDPSLTAREILGGLRQALAYLGTSVLPQGADGRTTEEFVDLVVAFAKGTPPTTTTTTTTSTTTSTTTTSSITTTTIGSGCYCCCFWIPQYPFGWDCHESAGPVDGGLCSYSAPGSGECGTGYCEAQSTAASPP